MLLMAPRQQLASLLAAPTDPIYRVPTSAFPDFARPYGSYDIQVTRLCGTHGYGRGQAYTQVARCTASFPSRTLPQGRVRETSDSDTYSWSCRWMIGSQIRADGLKNQRAVIRRRRTLLAQGGRDSDADLL